MNKIIAIVVIAVMALFAAFTPVPAHAIDTRSASTPPRPGDLDLDFDGDGKLTAPLGTNGGWIAFTHHDGQHIVAGTAINGSTRDIAVEWYNADGGLAVKADVISVGEEDLVTDLAVRDGKVVVAGYTAVPSVQASLFVLRYLPDGELDPDFGSNGRLVVDLQDVDRSGASAVAIQPDGKVVVAAEAWRWVGDGGDGVGLWAVARYESNGTPDRNFGENGQRLLTAPAGYEWTNNPELGLQSDGTIVLAGGYAPLGEPSLHRVALARVDSDGTVLGVQLTNPGGSIHYSNANDWRVRLAVQDDDQIVAAATTAEGKFAILRFAANGLLDTSFGGGGISLADVGSEGALADITLQRTTDGGTPVQNIVAAGSGSADLVVARFSHTGALDGQFGDGGIVHTDFGGWDWAEGVGIQQDGKIVVGGVSTTGTDALALARYHGAYTGACAEGLDLGPLTVTGNGWSMQAEISDDDGLVVSDLMLKNRYIAQSVRLPYARLQLLGLPSKRLELEPAASGPYRSCLTAFAINEPRLPGRPLVVTASYRFADVSDSELIVEQRYEFYPEIDEGSEDPSLHCEPSVEAPSPDRPFPMTCARWAPMVTYEFLPGGQDILEDFEVVQRLHIRPDGRPIRGSVLMHDCEEDESGILSEPCWIPSLKVGALLSAPPADPSGFLSDGILEVPGIRLKDDTLALERETLEKVIVGGRSSRAAPYDNIHLTNKSVVDLPIPLPPGCPECVHFHWRWSEYFEGDQFGHGQPLLPPGSNQDVTVAVLNGGFFDLDPQDYRALFDPTQPLEPSFFSEPILWHAATGHQLQDTFFSYGGFASSLEPWATLPADIALLEISANTEKVSPGQRYWYSAYYENNGPEFAVLHRVTFTLPDGLEFVPDSSRPVPERSQNCSKSAGRTVVCEYGDAFDSLWPGTTNTVDMEVEVVGLAGTELRVKAEASALNPDLVENNVKFLTMRIEE